MAVLGIGFGILATRAGSPNPAAGIERWRRSRRPYRRWWWWPCRCRCSASAARRRCSPSSPTASCPCCAAPSLRSRASPAMPARPARRSGSARPGPSPGRAAACGARHSRRPSHRSRPGGRHRRRRGPRRSLDPRYPDHLRPAEPECPSPHAGGLRHGRTGLPVRRRDADGRRALAAMRRAGSVIHP